MSCENCGLPEGALFDQGQKITITRRAENNYKRDAKALVWVCSGECGVQALGVSKYGHATCKWPVTLAQARASVKRQGLIE
jgi:hypothetical protein